MIRYIPSTYVAGIAVHSLTAGAQSKEKYTAIRKIVSSGLQGAIYVILHEAECEEHDKY